MTRRPLLVATTALVALVVGWAQPMPAAEAAFDASATASAAVTAHALEKPVLTCDPGGLVTSQVVLRWPAVAGATTPHRYGAVANSFLVDSYEIHRSVNGGGFALRASVGPGATSWSESPGGIATYRYKVLVKKSTWVGEFSDQVTATVASVLFLGVITSCQQG